MASGQDGVHKLRIGRWKPFAGDVPFADVAQVVQGLALSRSRGRIIARRPASQGGHGISPVPALKRRAQATRRVQRCERELDPWRGSSDFVSYAPDEDT